MWPAAFLLQSQDVRCVDHVGIVLDQSVPFARVPVKSRGGRERPIMPVRTDRRVGVAAEIEFRVSNGHSKFATEA